VWVKVPDHFWYPFTLVVPEKGKKTAAVVDSHAKHAKI